MAFFLPPANEDQPSSNDGVSTVPVVVGSVVAVVVISVVVIIISLLLIRYHHKKKSLIISKPLQRYIHIILTVLMFRLELGGQVKQRMSLH